MKIFYSFIFLAVFTFPSAFGRSLDEIKKTGTLKLAVDGMTPGFNFFKGKELSGFEIELGSEIGKNTGLKIEWVVQPFHTLLVALNQSRFDVISTTHSITEERQRFADFTDPLYCTGAVLVTKEGGPTKVSELQGKVVVLPTGTTYFQRVKQIPGIKEVRTVPNETDGLQSLLFNRADVWVTEQFVAMEAIKAQKGVKFVIGESILPQRNAWVVSKGNASVRDFINRELRKLQDSGFYLKLSLKYFGKDIRCSDKK